MLVRARLTTAEHLCPLCANSIILCSMTWPSGCPPHCQLQPQPKGDTPPRCGRLSSSKQHIPYPAPMTPKPVALVQLVVQKLMAPKPVALQPASLLPLAPKPVALSSLPVCAFLVVDWAQMMRMNYQMKKKMNSDESCQQVSRS